MKEQLKSSPEVSVNSPSDRPAGGVISTEISPAVVAPEKAAQPAPLPFGVYAGSGKPAAPAPSENVKP